MLFLPLYQRVRIVSRSCRRRLLPALCKLNCNFLTSVRWLTRYSTSTTTTVTTVTDLGATLTLTTGVDSTQLNTVTNTATSFTTIEDTLTITQPSAVQVTSKLNSVFQDS
jgi:hypothetical protein